MIGRGAAGSSGPIPARTPIARSPTPTVRDTIADGWTTFRERADLYRPVLTFVSRLVSIARWVLERVAIIERVEWYRWETRHDERTCPECGPLDGRTWPDTHAMPAPPLHVNCRCRVVHARTEWRVRHIPTWQLHWSTRRLDEWTRTGWA